jgi:hypothetical protein
MDREQFFEQLSRHDEERLKKTLWNLYWRGSAVMRERIEAELEPDGAARRRRADVDTVDPRWTLHEVREFVELARAGAYLGGDRRVAPRERPRWRFIFQRLVRDTEIALRNEDVEDVEDGAASMEMLLDLAQEMRSYDYFRSGDPIEAARVVVSDEAALLWSRVRERLGFEALARSAAPQLVRWESRHGWTRMGSGQVRAKETSLAVVLSGMLSAPDAWVGFADSYLEALDAIAADGAAKVRRDRQSSDRDREDRARNLAEWHHLLLDRLFDSEAEDRLDKIAVHPALAGPGVAYFGARLAHRRGDLARARGLVVKALERLPGRQEYLDFALEIGAELPTRAEAVRPGELVPGKW